LRWRRTSSSRRTASTRACSRARSPTSSRIVDYADLYFQATRSEAWSLEEGIVKSGSFSIDQGVGVRAVAGDRTAFAYSTTCRRKPSPRRPRPPGDRGGGRRPPEDQGGDVAEGITGRDLYLPSDPLASLDATAKVKLLERIEQMARGRDPRVTQVMAGLAGEYDVVLVARSDGALRPTSGRWCACPSR
jgi:TldD protein